MRTRQRHSAGQADAPIAQDPLLDRIYRARGIRSDDELDLSLERLLPFSGLLNIDKAARRLSSALHAQEKVLIVGDYDADGATATALITRAMRRYGAEDIQYLAPNRFQHGYGLSPAIVDMAIARRPDVIITVDNGISSIDGVEQARQAGIDVIITDHHLPGRQLPPANVIVNPNQPGCAFASRALAGVGVALYVMLATRAALREQEWFEKRGQEPPNLAEYLDLVALGTVADMVPLDRNNRVLVRQGINRIRAGRACPGIRALLQIAGADAARLRASDLGFTVAPRLNAAGRLDDMSIGIECLLADNEAEAFLFAQELDAMNAERKTISLAMQSEAEGIIERMRIDNAPAAYCLHQDDWHQGVIGILAGRIKDQTHRPTIAFARDGDQLKGSARSIAGFHIRDALDNIATEHPGLITRFGGHAMAAGLSLPCENLQPFTAAFTHHADTHIPPEHRARVILTDGALAFADLTLQTARKLEQAGPWGQGFPEPCFEGVFTVAERKRLGNNQEHVKALLRQDQKHIEALAFFTPESEWPEHWQTVRVVYQLSINRFRGAETLQLLARHVAEA